MISQINKILNELKRKVIFFSSFFLFFIFSDYFSFFSSIFDVTVLTVILSFIQSHSRFFFHRTFFKSSFSLFIMFFLFIILIFLLLLIVFVLFYLILPVIVVCQLFSFIHLKFCSAVISVLFSYLPLLTLHFPILKVAISFFIPFF